MWAQVTSRPISAELTMIEPVAFYNVPAFGALSEVDDAQRRQCLRIAGLASRGLGSSSRATSYRDPRWEKIRVATCDAFPELVGRPLLEVAAERGTNALETMLDVALADDLSTRFHITLANDDAEAVTSLLRAEGCVLGTVRRRRPCRSALRCRAPHRLPVRLGSRRRRPPARSRRPQAHRRVGRCPRPQRSRATCEAGHAADIVVFDLDKLSPGPLSRVTDLPGGATRLLGDQPTGITHVLVNGTPTCVDGRHLLGELDDLPGQLLGNG